MLRVMSGISIVLVVLLSAAIMRLEYVQNKLAQLQGALDLQNAAIEKMKLESEKYHCDLDSLNAYTRQKYQRVSENEQTCEGKLAEFEKALGIFKDRE